MPAKKGSGNCGGTEAFSNDIIITQGPGYFSPGSYRSLMPHYFVNFICLFGKTKYTGDEKHQEVQDGN